MIDIKPRALRISLKRVAGYFRRLVARERDAQRFQVTVADLTSFAETFADIDDPNVMSRAWR